MPIKNIPIEGLDEIEENHTQTAINESWPDEPSLKFQDLTTQNVDPEDLELLITGFIAAPPVEFHPLNYIQRKWISTEVFKLDFDINQAEVQYVKCGSTLNEKSLHLVKMAGDGHCFFHSISCLLTGDQSQHYKICQQLCDFIESEENLGKLRAFLGHHNTGKDYVLSSKMRQEAWATEVEMISLALLAGKDLVCYYNQKWEWHPASGNVANPTINAFYMDKSSGCHFNTLVGPWKFLPSNFLSSRFLPSLFFHKKDKMYIFLFIVHVKLLYSITNDKSKDICIITINFKSDPPFLWLNNFWQWLKNALHPA